MSRHVSRLLINSIIKQNQSFLLKKIFLPFVPPEQSCCCLWQGALTEVEWKMPRKSHGPQWGWHLIHQKKQRKVVRELQHCQVTHQQMDMRLFWGCSSLQTFLIMWQGILCWSEKVWCVICMPASEKKHLLGKERKKKTFQKSIVSYAELHPDVERWSKVYSCHLVVYRFLFNFAFSFLSHKSHLF